jgi:hypothetical protein
MACSLFQASGHCCAAGRRGGLADVEAHTIDSNVLGFVRLNGARMKKSSSSVESMSFCLKRTIANMATSRKIAHLWEWKEIVCWDTTSREPRPQIQSLEMLHYPDRQEPDVDDGILDDSSLSGWFSKVKCWN